MYTIVMRKQRDLRSDGRLEIEKKKKNILSPKNEPTNCSYSTGNFPFHIGEIDWKFNVVGRGNLKIHYEYEEYTQKVLMDSKVQITMDHFFFPIFCGGGV